MSEIGVVELWRYPVKSLGGEMLASAHLDPVGVEHDREFAIADFDTGKLLSRKDPKNIRLLEATASVADGVLTLSHPIQGTVSNEIRSGAADRFELTVLDDTVNGVTQDREFTEFLQALLGTKRDIELIKTSTDHTRTVDPSFLNRKFTTTFTDGYPLTVVSKESLAALAAALDNPDVPPNINDLIRANIIIDGLEPFEEDHLGQLIIGSTIIAIAKASSRCVMTEQIVSPEGRAVRKLGTLRALRKMGRIGYNGTNTTPQALFAQNAVVVDGGRIGVHDIVRVWSDSAVRNWTVNPAEA